jgi:hypothetical protein
MKGKCNRCQKPLTTENASFSVATNGYGRCRSCEIEHTKKRSRTLGGKFNLGSAQARYNGHKWGLDFRQYAAIMAFEECFYCGAPLPTAAGGLDRKENEDYTWDAVLPCCGKQPKAIGPREAAMKPKAFNSRQSCFSPTDGTKNSASYLQSKISSIDYKRFGLREIEHTKFFAV